MKFKIDLHNLVYNYKTKYNEGFIKDEILYILSIFPNITRKKFDNALFGITTTTIDNEIIIYRHDLVLALKCGLENRNPNTLELD